MAYYATQYTIHFDDTMAYGSHHFLTGFKFQCESRESYLFGDRIFDLPGVPEALENVHLFTGDAYSRNLSPCILGDRVAILLTLEEWGRISARFCYRVISEQGKPVCAGFQTLICADAKTGQPVQIPKPLRDAMNSMREIEEPDAGISFRDRVLKGGDSVDRLFSDTAFATAKHFLSDRYPKPGVIPAVLSSPTHPASPATVNQAEGETDETLQTWVFSGQGTFDANLLSQRVRQIVQRSPAAKQELERCAAIVNELIGGDALAIVSGEAEACKQAVQQTPDLMQCAIHLQNVIGAQLLELSGRQPDLLMGHSFGEIAALGVSGCFDLETGIRIVCHRVLSVNAHAPKDGELLVVATNRQQVTSEAAIIGLDQVVVAGRNHETQTVASGPAAQLKLLKEHFTRQQISAVKIASPTSFHHPSLREAGTEWLRRISSLPIDAPKRRVFSPIGRRMITNTDNIAAILASQFTRPFDLQGAMSDVVAAGSSHFIDCGSAGAIQRLLTIAGPDNVVVSGSSTHSPTEEQKSRPELSPSTPPAPSTDGTLVPTIAIVGQGCVLPGGASSPSQLFAALQEQRLGIVDQSKLDPYWLEDFYSEELAPDRSTSLLFGVVNEEDIVVPAGIDPTIFASFTRAQKLLCISLAPCLSSLRGVERVTCFVGSTADGFRDQDIVSSLRYAGLDPTDEEIDRHLNTARSAFEDPHSAIQTVFDKIVRPGLKITLVDAACASSLYTVALGMRALESNETDAVLAGGVLCPGPGPGNCFFSQFRGTTATGLRPFDANADGVVFAEGASMVVLRRLADAESENLTVHAIMRGFGLSSDGRSSSANVPQTHGQILSLERCYSNYRIDPSTVNAIEAHGTSTRVGDSTEIYTLLKCFKGKVTKSIPVHSLKGLIGHTGWAAGTASIIATCEYLRNGTFPGQAFFREPSKAVNKSRGTLHVTATSSPLPKGDCRIAVEGFGFGGANAHVVIDRYTPGKTPTEIRVSRRDDSKDSDSELVCVAVHQIHPTQDSPSGKRFDRQNLTVPKGHLLLPDLADDMDISQTLAITLADQIIAKLSQFNDDLRKQTSVMLAFSEKTERGIEAILRVHNGPFRRALTRTDHVAKLDAAMNSARPSGPYSLQCMMPNVAAGRAALQLNLQGPNFVVDAGQQSFAAVLNSAKQLLSTGDESGNKLAIVAAINANLWKTPKANGQSQGEECAAAFGITTRRHANELGLPVLGPAEALVPTDNQPLSKQTNEAVSNLLGFETATEHEDDEFPIHAPVWVESSLDVGRQPAKRARALVITRGDRDQVQELHSEFTSLADQTLIVVVGSGASAVAGQLNQNNLIAVDVSDQRAIDSALSRVASFNPDTIVALETLKSWGIEETLDKLKQNELCEFLFLTAQHLTSKLDKGELELWGLFPGGYKDAIHPATGATAGFLKATVREIPGCRVGIVSTSRSDLRTSLNHLQAEWSCEGREPEMVYDGDTRLIRRLRPTAKHNGCCQVELSPESVVLATGGARGVTAVLMDALLKDYGCKVVCLGRSAIEKGPANEGSPDAERDFYQRYIAENPGKSPTLMKRSFTAAQARWEAYQTIQQLNSVGGEVHYLQADVTNPDDVARVVQTIYEKFGRVDLLVHGAGVQYSKKLQDRSLDEFRLTYGVKVGGLHNMVQAIGQQFGKTIPAHVLTSAYSVFGNDGQHDYGAANETMDRLCGITKTDSNLNWSSIAWLGWEGIGMTRGTEYQALAKQRGLSGLSPITGQRVFRNAFRGSSNAAINVPISVQEHVNYNLRTVPKTTAPNETTRIREISVRLSDIPCLQHHVVKGLPTLPGAWTMERMIEVSLPFAAVQNPTSAIITNASFNRFVKLVNNMEPDIRIIAEQSQHGIDVTVLGNVLHSSGRVLTRDVVFARAQIEFQNKPASLISSLSGAQNNRPDRQVVTDLRDPYCVGGEVCLSGPFDCLRDLKFGDAEREAQFVPCNQTNWAGKAPALLLDGALRLGAMYPSGNPDALFVPLRIGRLVVPLNMDASSVNASGWRIRSTNPVVDGRQIRWSKTEVVNAAGESQLMVEGALAQQMG